MFGCRGARAGPGDDSFGLFLARVPTATILVSHLAFAIARALRVGKAEDGAWHWRLRGQVPRLATVARARKVVEDLGAGEIATADDAVPTITEGDREYSACARASCDRGQVGGPSLAAVAAGEDPGIRGDDPGPRFAQRGDAGAAGCERAFVLLCRREADTLPFLAIRRADGGELARGVDAVRHRDAALRRPECEAVVEVTRIIGRHHLVCSFMAPPKLARTLRLAERARQVGRKSALDFGERVPTSVNGGEAPCPAPQTEHLDRRAFAGIRQPRASSPSAASPHPSTR